MEFAEAERKLDATGYLNLSIPKDIDLVKEIISLRKEKNAIILAHYYQDGAIQDYRSR